MSGAMPLPSFALLTRPAICKSPCLRESQCARRRSRGLSEMAHARRDLRIVHTNDDCAVVSGWCIIQRMLKYPKRYIPPSTCQPTGTPIEKAPSAYGSVYGTHSGPDAAAGSDTSSP
jgi:hypothetical protein